MDASSKAKSLKLHPLLAERVERVIADLATAGREVRIVSGLRTYAEQDALYAQGRTKPGDKVTNARAGQSNHNFGLACDLAPFKDGKAQWNDVRGFQAIGVAAKHHGLNWGGDWLKFPDRPHVELDHKLKITTCHALFQSGGLQKVWAAANKNLGAVSNETPNSPSVSVSATIHANPTGSLPLLLLGSRGGAVKQLQEKLKEKGYSVNVDGIFGAATDRALRAFQRANKLGIDGKAGKKTLEALGL